MNRIHNLLFFIILAVSSFSTIAQNEQQDNANFTVTFDIEFDSKNSLYLKLINQHHYDDENELIILKLIQQFNKKNAVFYRDSNFSIADTLKCGLSSFEENLPQFYVSDSFCFRLKTEITYHDNSFIFKPIGIALVLNKNGKKQELFWLKSIFAKNIEISSPNITWGKKTYSPKIMHTEIESSSQKQELSIYIMQKWLKGEISLGDKLAPICDYSEKQTYNEKIKNAQNIYFQFVQNIFFDEEKEILMIELTEVKIFINKEIATYDSGNFLWLTSDYKCGDK